MAGVEGKRELSKFENRFQSNDRNGLLNFKRERLFAILARSTFVNFVKLLSQIDWSGIEWSDNIRPFGAFNGSLSVRTDQH